MRPLTDNDLPLECIYRWEQNRAQHLFLTQPFDGGKVRDWTWSQATDEVRRMAAYLTSQNWEPGTRIAILSRNCAWWILADFAIWMAGHVSVPIYPSLRAQTIRQILEHSESRCCFLGPLDDFREGPGGIPRTMPCIGFPNAPDGEYTDWDSIVATNPPMTESPTRHKKDLATIIYTSGTTGTPKGVMHHFEALAMDALICTTTFQLTVDQRILSYLPLAHVVERMGVEICSAFLGSRIFFTEGIETFLLDLRRARPTLFLSVPRLMLKFQQGVFAKVPKEKLEKFLRIPVANYLLSRRILRQLGLGTVRMAAVGAAPLPVAILEWYRQLGLQLVEGYGMTETWITHLPSPRAIRPGYVGPPLPGVEQRLGENDELQIRSPMTMVGYYKDPQTTEAAFTPDGFFRTGDVARIDPDGQVKLIGRVKEQFKTSKGKYVAPAPIESRLLTHPAIESGCLMGAGMPSPFAVIVLSEDARQRAADPAARAALEESLRAQVEELNAQLDPHERVKFVAIADGSWTVGNGLVTPTLKIKRALVEARYQGFIEEWRNRAKPVVWETEPGVTAPPYQAKAAAEHLGRQSD